ncbi:MAG TPA: hypothetical protein VFO18_14385 [Methylomirabilota bacterium]|nr:hypothetical protein [Methylomirabilota bacterium]
MRRSVRIGALTAFAIGLFAAAPLPGGAMAAEKPASEDALDLLPITPEQHRRLVRGDVVSYAVTEHSERELAVALAIFVPVPAPQLAQYLVSGQLIADDVTISDFGIVPEPAAADAWSGARFTESERGEAESLLDASPGSRFNLSPAEIQALRALRDSSDRLRGSTAVELGSEAYRRLLRQRLQAYQQGGLAAIPPYARSGGVLTDPTAELRLAVADTERLARTGSMISDVLLRYPAAQPPQVVHRFYWIKRRVQRRPDLSLLHQIVAPGPDPVVHVERYFYVGHSYNAAQIVTGAFAYESGSVVFATSRFSTDEILGVASQMKRAVGRGQLRDEMRKRLERLRTLLILPQPVQSP